MSLDVYLKVPGASSIGSGIFVREDGQTKEITRAEWEVRFPGREPIVTPVYQDDGEVYSANITHNLWRMADAAGIHDCLWEPDKHGITKAEQLIDPLRKGLDLLQSDPERFKQYNPSNGWGNYEGLVSFVERYLLACVQYPHADVVASR